MIERNPVYIWKIKVWRNRFSPLPHWLVVSNSAIIVGISAVMAGLALGLVIAWADLYSVLGGIVLLPLPLTVVILQYMAAFRQNIGAVKAVMIIHYSATALLGTLLLLCLRLIIFGSNVYAPKALSLLIVILLICIPYCGFCGWMNRRFGMHLSVSADLDELPPPELGKRTNQFTLRELMAWAVIVSIMASAAGYVIQQNNILSGPQ